MCRWTLGASAGCVALSRAAAGFFSTQPLLAILSSKESLTLPRLLKAGLGTTVYTHTHTPASQPASQPASLGALLHSPFWILSFPYPVYYHILIESAALCQEK